MPISPTISAVIITKNEEKHLANALESLHGLVNEIIVVDSFSTDKTEQIAGKYGAQFIQKEWEGYAATKNYGNSLAQGPLILSLDADECLSATLRSSIALIASQSCAFSFNRRNIYCGKAIWHAGWYPDRKIRLFPKGKAQWQGDFVHEKLIVEPGLDRLFLNGDLLHYSYATRQEHIEREKKYARLAAERDKGKTSLAALAYLKAFVRFVKMYVFKTGFLDGYLGLQLCLISARGKLWKHSYLKELNASDLA